MKLFRFILFLCLWGYIATHAQESCLIHNSTEKIPVSPENLLRIIHKQAEQLMYIIESLIDDIQHNVVHTHNNRNTIEQLTLLRHSICTCLTQQPSSLDTSTLGTLLNTITCATHNLGQGISTAFLDWQAIIPITRSEKFKTYEQISEQAEILTPQLACLRELAPYLGLSRVRIWYRTFCNALTTLHINTSNARKILVAGTLVSWLYFTRNMPRRGSDNILRLPNNKEIDPAQLNFFLRTIDWLYTSWGIDLTPNKWNIPIPLILMEYSLKDDMIRTHTWFTKKLRAAHYYLKGHHPPKDLVKTYPTHGFEKVRGNEQNKKEAYKIIEYIINHDRFTQKNISFQQGLLLLGKVRSGKTFFAQTLCGELNKHRSAHGLSLCPFIHVDASKLASLQGWQKSLKGYIDLAHEEAPCILFIDELHQLVKDDKKTLSELLTGMNCLFEEDPEHPVIIIAATNHPELIDHALRQKGRFGIELQFEYPPFHERRDHLRSELQETFFSLSNEHLDALAYETESCPYDDLNELVIYMKQQATIHKKALSSELLEEALDTVIRKIKAPEIILDLETKHVIAIHQASHIVAIKKLSPQTIITKATLAPVEIKTEFNQSSQLGAVFSYVPTAAPVIYNPTRLIATCKELLAGHVGEVVFFGTSSYAYQQETAQALAICKQLSARGITTHGTTAQKIELDLMRQAITLKNQYEQELQLLLSQEKPLISRIAQTLEQKELLTQQEIIQLLDT